MGGSAHPPHRERRTFTVLVHADFLGRWVLDVVDLPGGRDRVARLREVRPRATEIICQALSLEADGVHLVIRYREPSTY